MQPLTVSSNRCIHANNRIAESPSDEAMKHHYTVNRMSKEESSAEESGSTRKIAQSGESAIQQPTEFDVLFGRGKPYQDHPGNLRLHRIVNVYKENYFNARRHEKTAIAEEVVKRIKTNGKDIGRFLKRVEFQGRWEEVLHSVARAKVSNALRGKSTSDNSSRIKSKIEICDVQNKRAELGILSKKSKPEWMFGMPPAESVFSQHPNMMVTTSPTTLPSPKMVPALPFTYQSLLLNNIRAEREQLILQELAAGSLHPPSMRQPPASYYQNARLLEALRTNQIPIRGLGPDPRQSSGPN